MINLRDIALIGTLVAGFGIARGFQEYMAAICPSPNPLRVEDVNSDGIEDKILQRKVAAAGPYGISYVAIEETVLLGVDVNGQRTYLPRTIFETYIE